MKSEKTWNQHVVKKENKFLVFKTVIQSSPISRAEIATKTGLNKGTVSSLVNELIEEKFIYESGPGESSGGRRPVMLLFNETAGYSIGINIGVNYLLGVLTDLNGNIHLEKQININSQSFEVWQEKLFSMIHNIIQSTPKSPYGIIGIGVGVPGTVNMDGKVLLAPNLSWKNIELQSILEEEFKIPTIIENEANAGAYGEKKYGVGKDSNHLIYVSVGIGIGVGMILNGQLYKGNNGFSGELGHMSINVKGDLCRCGNEGCWELYASEQALIQQAKKLNLLSADQTDLSFEYLLDLAENGNEKAIYLFNRIGEYLGVGLNNIINIFNPQEIVIGNRMASTKKWIQTSLESQLADRIQFFQEDDLQIKFSNLSSYSAALGVSAFSTENFLQFSIH
ncbi:ROK family transcriptional regulator [Lederbergia galactosidilytica]|uniref:ROK family protein n=1 Tax=Lederbergia galactosidilytica TaxID=217031 RepID=A0A177ZWM0_9BACI|nr:ROK family transcriptional regulator [Lederbergia galactosidilytica]KRG12432.1 ROK family protein [Virgibacillus soli]MBP1916620.1 putative NBD/HSP70 family sugar kinase [Lederbergia galactosidilytica]OAK72234.1 ROK family protein [Lederbergia galactosidilytica]